MLRNYFIRKLLNLAPLFLGITFISFAVMRLAPGSPVDARSDLNPKITVEAKLRFEKIYGLDRPFIAQYWVWLKRVAKADFGRSFVDGENVSAKIAHAAPITLWINLLSLFVVCLAGIWIGVIGAAHEGKRLDHTLTILSLAGFSAPTFWLALLAMSFFGVQLRILPVSGLVSVFFDQMSLWEKTLDLARHLVLPVLVSSVTGIAGISRLTRSGMIETLKEDFIRTARAKGLPERQVFYGHALKNAILPVVTILGLSVPGLLGGSVIFESIFSIPGMGRLFFNSVFARDYPVIMGILVLGAFLTLIGNLLADLAYGLLDPRIRL